MEPVFSLSWLHLLITTRMRARRKIRPSLPVNPPAHARRRLISVEIRKSVEKSGNHLRNREIRKSAKKSDENRDIAGNREFVIRNLEITKEIMYAKLARVGPLGKWWTSSVHRLVYHSCTLTILVNVSGKLEEASKIVSISSVQRKQVRTEC